MIRSLAFGASLLAALTVPAAAEPFVPSDRAAVDLVRSHVTGGYVTVASTIAYAEKASRGAFAFAGFRVEDRPGEPFKHVRICYRLGIDPPVCAIEYLVASNPSQVTPSDRYDGLGRDLEHGPRSFLRALAREASLQRQPEFLRKVQVALDRFNPYDWR
ncbi:hypothetical protein [Methylobacterium aerolatum]|uniref:Uncharacterized protein n=1 Tax=Methylobacterium aerolatum TaxID=418708 RepID=A0ABU0HZC2_9HYPH|nr:hypothetical protein [Methylobacterium aerolatum]MDQ0447698.1 hypothetical protein [Methylobacterium aerolatum]GJD34798.1 hypothetical protein FMGBMHLM_1701 [Methylobacterium aerolatum]